MAGVAVETQNVKINLLCQGIVNPGYIYYIKVL